MVVEVTNELAVIDGITVVADCGRGLDVVASPALLPLFPDTVGSLTLALTPTATFPAGAHRLQVEVRSSVEPSASTTIDLDLDVAPVPKGALTVVPPSREARHRTSYSVVLDNPGNTTLEVALAASDGDRALRSVVEPPTVVVDPGTSATATLRVTGRRKLYGTQSVRAVTVVGTAAGLALDTRADFRTRPLVPAGARTVLVLACIVAVWAGIFVVALTKAYSGDPITKDVPPSFYAASPAARTSSGRSALGALGTFRFETAASDGSGPAGAVPKSGVAIGIGGTVTGTVDAASTSAGVGRITVEAIRTTPQGPALVSSAATGADGNYSLPGLLPGDYYLLFTADGYRDVWYPSAPSQAAATPVTVDSQAQTSGINATIEGLPATIVGSVVTGSTAAVPVTVTVQPGQGATTPIATARFARSCPGPRGWARVWSP
ncbi:MAG TPA: carboxypeptidase-like regulatory domain-containing protein [Acidimicrobiales bacterium]|nr:carboxypeptidase-like regulatory domain-containing protein [Acidimicrobiales bacterium]